VLTKIKLNPVGVKWGPQGRKGTPQGWPEPRRGGRRREAASQL